MIKNERQYRITKVQAERFEKSITDLGNEPLDARFHPRMREVQAAAMQSQLDDLRAELKAYEALRSGETKVLELDAFEQLPRALIQARIASGLSQKALADRLGLKEQQIQRYEATEYAGASLERVQEVMKALGVTVREDVFLASAEVSQANLFRRLKQIGLDGAFLTKRVIPRTITAKIEGTTDAAEASKLTLQAASVVNRVFQLTPTRIFSGAPLQLSTTAATETARFKVPARVNEERTSAYTVYALYLALLALEATTGLPQRVVPIDPQQAREEIVAQYGSVTFETTLRYAWDLGVVVLPLDDAGAFHGACWRVDGRNIIALKQQVKSVDRWLFDLLHELFHAAYEPEMPERIVIEASEASKERRESQEEEWASLWAGRVVLNGRAGKLAQECVRAAGSDTRLLKNVVQQIAERENLSVGALANYMAFRLSRDTNESWWSTAATLQTVGEDPWRITRDIFLSKMNINRLNETDQNLLIQALSDV